MPNQQNSQLETSNQISRKEIIFYSSIGAVIATIIDASINESLQCRMFGAGITKLLHVDIMVADSLGAIFVVFLAPFIVSLDKGKNFIEFKSNSAAFLAGLMIFSTIGSYTSSVAVGDKGEIYSSQKGSSDESSTSSVNPSTINWDPSHPTESQINSQSRIMIDFSSSSLYPINNDFIPNAKIIKNSLTVSECKPSYYGFLGLVPRPGSS